MKPEVTTYPELALGRETKKALQSLQGLLKFVTSRWVEPLQQACMRHGGINCCLGAIFETRER